MIESTATLHDLRALSPEVPMRLAAARPRVVVLGDLLLDSWWEGTVERMCREAPAPVVDMSARRYAPGGAANTAINLAAMGARVAVVGTVGSDSEGSLLLSLLEEAGIDTARTLVVPGHRTRTKTRIVSAGQVMLRMDDGASTLAPSWISKLEVAAETAAAEADAFVIADYGSGQLPVELAATLRDRASEGTLFIVDAHDARPWAPLKPEIVTPNWLEATLLAGTAFPGGRRGDWLLEHCDAILASTQAACVVVTMDAEGTMLLDAAGRQHRTWARPVLDTQTAGAGDTFAAALAIGLCCQMPLTTALDLAQTAADIVVHRTGTAVCTTADLAQRLGDVTSRVLDAGALEQKLVQARREGKRVVLTNGCFDVLHRGHTSYLNQARRLGDLLVVAINSDASVRRLKGPGRPLNPASDRSGVLAALSCVDYVTVFGEDTAVELVRRVRPDVYAKGGDYTPDMLREADEVTAHGGRVAILDYVPDHSTTALVEKMAAAGTPSAGANA